MQWLVVVDKFQSVTVGRSAVSRLIGRPEARTFFDPAERDQFITRYRQDGWNVSVLQIGGRA